MITHTHTMMTVAIACTVSSAVAQQYFRQSPSPTDMDIHGIEFIDQSTGWVAAGYANWGGVFGTADGGDSWDTIILGQTEQFKAIDMIDANTGWAVGKAIYKTTDGWQSWTRTDLPPAPAGEPATTQATQIQFFDANIGFMSTRPSLTHSYLYRTSDGGASWDYLGRFELDSWRFADADTGWAALEDTTFVRTNDGGQTWSPMPMPSATTTQSDVIEVFSYDHAIVTTFQDPEIRFSMHQTDDGGQTWDSSGPGTPRDAVFTDPMNGYGYAQFGAPATTTDGGMTWSEDIEAAIDHEYFESICIVGNSVFLGGQYGFIAASHDLGATWAQISNGTGNDLRGVGFADTQHGWATSGGTILGTTDGGDVWRHLPGPELTLFQALFTTGPGDVYPFSPTDVAIEWNVVNLIRTSDGGQSWTLEDPDETWPGGRIYVADTNTYYKLDLTNGGSIHRTTDRGQTWTTTPATGLHNFDQGDTIYDFYFFDDVHGWVLGGPNIGYRTRDGGATWERTPDIRHLPLPVYRRVRFTTPDIGWIVGSYGLILRTTDGGDTWAEQTLPDTFDATYTDIVPVNELEAYICGKNEDNLDFIKRTTDGGITWTDEYTPGLGHPFQFFNSSNNRLAHVDGSVWAVGIWGGIVHKRAAACFPDTNGDGLLSPTDFNAWIIAFNTGADACDQNGDGLCTPVDFNAWILNFNAGCPKRDLTHHPRSSSAEHKGAAR